jgi:hypothetical protein
MSLSSHTTSKGSISFSSVLLLLLNVDPQVSCCHQSTQHPHFSRQYPSIHYLDVLTFASRQQPNAETQSIVAEQWIRLILAYARHQKLFILRMEDAETTGGDWEEIFWNPRINRASSPFHTH